jgi:hypothetical protein
VPNIAGARRYIEVPAPAPKVGGLFAVARVIDTTDPHDLLGAEYQTDSCLPAQHWSAGNCGYGYPESLCNPDPDPVATLKTLRGIGTLVTGDPFTVYDGIECEPIGYASEELAAKAKASLLLKEAVQVEKHIEALIMAMDTDITPSGTPVDIVAAVGLLEEWLDVNYAGLGMMHMARKYATWAINANVVGAGLDGTLATIQGTPVANAAGYAPTDQIIGATGQITLLRGPVMVNYAPPVVNGLTCEPPRVVAERTFVPLIECGAATVKVARVSALVAEA